MANSLPIEHLTFDPTTAVIPTACHSSMLVIPGRESAILERLYLMLQSIGNALKARIFAPGKDWKS
ncbi:MAG: hypothetical protein ACKV1O_13390 [Saprospiraceae bacterium]